MNVIYDVALVIHECYLCCSREDQIEKIYLLRSALLIEKMVAGRETISTECRVNSLIPATKSDREDVY